MECGPMGYLSQCLGFPSLMFKLSFISLLLFFKQSFTSPLRKIIFLKLSLKSFFKSRTSVSVGNLQDTKT